MKTIEWIKENWTVMLSLTIATIFVIIVIYLYPKIPDVPAGLIN